MGSFRAILIAMRKRRRLVGAVLTGIAIGAGGSGFTALAPIPSALAEDKTDAENTVRPEIGKPIQAALDLLKRKRSKDALARVHEADAVANKTSYEAYLVERVRGQAEAAAGHASAAAHAFEATAASSAISSGERLQFLAAAAGQYYMAKDYGKVVALGARYFKDGGKDPSIRTLHIQALYLSNNFAAAGKELLSQIQAEEQADKAPAEAQLQLLANIYFKQRDTAGYANVLEKLVAYYPKKDYWLDVIGTVRTRPGFSGRLALDVARLKLATGTMRVATEYFEAASLQIGLPAEAKKIIDQGYAAGLLGTGPEADRHRRLKDMAAKSLAEDKATLGQDDAQLAASKDDSALFVTGLNHVLNGGAGKGLAIKQGFINALKRKNTIIGFVDADMATQPQYFYELFDIYINI